MSNHDIRGYREEDKAFILATFLRGLYYGDSWFSSMPKDVFMNNYKKVGQALLDSPHCVVRVACLREDPDVILGYSILGADFNSIHWVYVKSKFRKMGIGRSLLPANPTIVTHLSKQGKALLSKFPNCVFDPFQLR